MDTVINTSAAKPELSDEAVVAYNNGASLNTLSKKFNVNVSTVSRFLKAKGVVLRGRGRPRKVTA